MAYRRAVAIGLLVLTMSAPSAFAATPVATAAQEVALTADLDGVPIPLVAVGKFYCNDFDYPAIHCFRSADALTEWLQVDRLLETVSGTDYVQWWDQTYYGGAWMIASQDYDFLSLIGWNDRISSFKGRNLQTGMFATDWFAGGTWYTFCCNQQLPTLGSYNNTFSSVYNN